MEYPSYRSRGFIIYNPFFFVIRIFFISERGISRKMFTGIAFCFEYCANFLRRISCVPLIEYVFERRQVVFRLNIAVYVIVDRNKANVKIREIDFGVIPNHYVISAESRHILYDNRRNFTFFRVSHHSLKVGAVEVRTRKAVVNVEFNIGKAVFFRIFCENFFLMNDTVAISDKVVVFG